jgi:hypothetical protein
LRSFDEKPFVTKNGPKPIRWIKEFSLKKRIRRDRMNLPSIALWRGSQAITPPAFLFLNLLRCQTAGTGVPKPFRSPRPRPEVAAYMGRRFPRQHPFLRLLQFPVLTVEPPDF